MSHKYEGSSSLETDQKLEDKIRDHVIKAKIILIPLTLIIISLLIPVVFETTGNIGLLSENKDIVSITFEENPFLKYMFYVSVLLIVIQVWVVFSLFRKIGKLHKANKFTSNTPKKH